MQLPASFSGGIHVRAIRAIARPLVRQPGQPARARHRGSGAPDVGEGVVSDFRSWRHRKGRFLGPQRSGERELNVALSFGAHHQPSANLSLPDGLGFRFSVSTGTGTQCESHGAQLVFQRGCLESGVFQCRISAEGSFHVPFGRLWTGTY